MIPELAMAYKQEAELRGASRKPWHLIQPLGGEGQGGPAGVSAATAPAAQFTACSLQHINLPCTLGGASSG